jgi:phytoene dehydrogenase-like protein
MHSTNSLGSKDYDAVIVGAGPNGLAAAIEMARAGRATLLIEAEDTIGGAARSMGLTLPGFVHDIGAAITPLAVASPFMQTLPLEEYGVEWIYPPAALAHPLDGGVAAVLEGSVETTAAALGRDESRYLRLMGPTTRDWPKLAPTLLGPPARLPGHPLALARFGALGAWPSTVMIRRAFQTEAARALMAGFAAHAVLPLGQIGTAAFALLFAATGHTTGWPFPRGGMQSLSDAMGRYFESLGGEIVTGVRIESLRDIPPARSVLLDVPPGRLERLAGDALPGRYRKRLLKFRRGQGVFKVDYALSGPIPWRSPDVARAGTVHVGGTLDEVVAGEATVARGGHPDRPFVLLAQQSLFDATRAPNKRQTAWAYCHVPNGSTVDMTDRIESQIERFAPGFTDLILSRHTLSPADLEQLDANLLGGDITGGAQDLRQIVARPVLSLNPYATPLRGLFLCSASTPPGGGVHGMCGYWAARAALNSERKR